MISVNQSSHWEAWASLEHWCSEQRHGRAPVKEKEKKKEEKIKKIYTQTITHFISRLIYWLQAVADDKFKGNLNRNVDHNLLLHTKTAYPFNYALQKKGIVLIGKFDVLTSDDPKKKICLGLILALEIIHLSHQMWEGILIRLQKKAIPRRCDTHFVVIQGALSELFFLHL